MTRPASRQAAGATGATTERVSFHTAYGVIQQRCRPCHSAQPTDDTWKAAPAGVMFDSPDQVKRLAPRIKERAVVTRTMPLANKTNITQPERDVLGDWIDQGATVE